MKKQELQQISAYDRKAVHDMFIMTMEWLEKYIETVGYYPDWESRKQIRENNIKRKDIIGNPEKVKSSFSTVLFILQTNLQDVPPMFREEIKQEFYKWISAVGIKVDNCRSDELKIVLYQVNEILKGYGEKIQRDVENRQREVEMDSPEYMDKFKKMFASVQDPIRKEKEVVKNWKNKSDKDWKKESRFNSGSAEQGEQAFNQIAGSVANQQSDFYFFRQKGQSVDSQQTTNPQIIQDVKNNPQNWRLDEIITKYNNLGDAEEERVLVHQNARLNDYDQRTGKLNFDENPIYRSNRFSPEEIKEINQALNISQISNSPAISSANQEIRQWIINDFRQSGFKKVRVNFRENNYYEDWLVRDSVNVGGSITFDPKNMYKVKDLTEAEQKAIGYKSEQSLQNTFASTTPKNNDKSIGTSTILTIIGTIAILSIASVAIAKKKLNKKSMK